MDAASIRAFGRQASNHCYSCNGFRHAGIYSALGLLDEDELPDYNEISVESDYDDESDVVADNDSSSSEADERSSPHFLVEDIFTDSD